METKAQIDIEKWFIRVFKAMALFIERASYFLFIKKKDFGDMLQLAAIICWAVVGYYLVRGWI